MARKVSKSILGIPIWFITGLSVFIIFSVGYDLIVGDKNLTRYLILGASGLILLISIIIHAMSLKSVGRIAQRQMGR